MPPGFFITFEGGEGAGKSSQIRLLAESLPRLEAREVLVTREPGGSPRAEAVRRFLLSGAAEPFGPDVEAILFAVARADHVEQRIRPALLRGAVVLCDRFVDSSRVYQGVTGALDPKFMALLERVSLDGLMPDLTIILDINPEEGLLRAAKRRGRKMADRFEKETLQVHRIRQKAFLDIARLEPGRCTVIDASAPTQEVASAVLQATVEAMARKK